MLTLNRSETLAAFGAAVVTLAGFAVASGDSAWVANLPVCEIVAPAHGQPADLEPTPGIRLTKVKAVHCPNRRVALPSADTGVELAANIYSKVPETLLELRGPDLASGIGSHRQQASISFTLKFHPEILKLFVTYDTGSRLPPNLLTLVLSSQGKDGQWRVLKRQSGVLQTVLEKRYDWSVQILTDDAAPVKLELVMSVPGNGMYATLIPKKLLDDPISAAAIAPVINVHDARLTASPCIQDPSLPGFCQ